MRVPVKLAFLCVTAGLFSAGAFADEIRLKDGKKLYGVIVAYEDNMFKIKTDFGFVLVEKDKIASIVPSTPSSVPATAAAKPPAKNAEKKSVSNSAAASAAKSATSSAAVSDPSDPPAAKAKISSEPVRPAVLPTARTERVTPPAIKPAAPPATTIAAAPKEPEPPANKETIQGNVYTNISHGFRMYKAPSWEIIEDARRALPNAIVAMGTSNESTLLVVGQEPTKDSLDSSANGVEKRLREIYENYRMISRRKTVVGGAPAVEFKYTGKADEHDWSGTLVVVSRDQDVLTILGMTYADNDLIQIQENVIARAISSTDFNVH
jgi:hypothetical protein